MKGIYLFIAELVAVGMFALGCGLGCYDRYSKVHGHYIYSSINNFDFWFGVIVLTLAIGIAVGTWIEESR